MRTTVVRRGDRSEALLTRSVPLKYDALLAKCLVAVQALQDSLGPVRRTDRLEFGNISRPRHLVLLF